MQIIDTDVLIIGAGIAGLRAAIEIARKGKNALVVSKSSVGKANNTYLAGGLFTVSHGNFNRDAHLEKTLSSGRHLNKRSLVDKFVNEAPSMIAELQEHGLEGKFFFSGFATRGVSFIGGPKISSVLVTSCHKVGVGFLEDVMVTDLLVKDRTCLGAFGFHKRTGDLFGFRAGAVVLATGGAGAIFSEHDNAPGMTGDGYVLGLRASLELIDMEFVQFYPLVYAGAGKARMIIPAALGDLGEIKNRLGENLKEKYALHDKPIAIVSRDRFAQALYREIRLGNDVDGALFLDLRKTDDATIPGSPGFKAQLKKLISYDEVPVRIAPVSHHTMGGLVIDAEGHTGIENLFAAGEVVGGIHGANRMGGNALSEALVFGALAGSSAVEDLPSYRTPPDIKAMLDRHAQRSFHSRVDKNTKATEGPHLMKQIGQLMWKKSGILRNGTSLKEAATSIQGILKEALEQRAVNPWELSKLIECTHAAINAYVITVSALERTESRGSHYREDHPLEDESWKKNIHIKMSEGLPEISRVVVPR
jgi:succinate dehydrogenase/fumarate reductase flavoprotein subunit